MADDQPVPQIEYPYAPVAPLAPRPAPPATQAAAGPTWLGLIGMLALFALVNFFVVPLVEIIDDDSLIVAGCIGIMLAEAFVLAAYLVWGSGPFWVRFVLHWAAASILGMVWLVGAITAEGARDVHIRDALENIPMSLPLASLAIQLPLWIARLYFGWRLVDACADPAPTRQMSIRDLMLGTVIVAVSLAGARLAEGMLREHSDGWLFWAIAAPSLAGISLVSVLPVAVWLLRMRDLSIGLICIPVYTIIATIVTLIIVASNGPVRLDEVVIIAVVIMSFAAALSLAALAARAAGFRLATAWRAETT